MEHPERAVEPSSGSGTIGSGQMLGSLDKHFDDGSSGAPEETLFAGCDNLCDQEVYLCCEGLRN